MTPETLKRHAERLGSVGEPSSMGSWFVPFLGGDRLVQLEAYLYESLHCALTHREPLIALRAYGQACFYLGELRATVSGYGALSDTLMEARNRIESFIRGAS